VRWVGRQWIPSTAFLREGTEEQNLFSIPDGWNGDKSLGGIKGEKRLQLP